MYIAIVKGKGLENVQSEEINSNLLINDYNCEIREMYANDKYCTLFKIKDDYEYLSEIQLNLRLKSFIIAVFGTNIDQKQTLNSIKLKEMLKQLLKFEDKIHLYRIDKYEFDALIDIFIHSIQNEYTLMIN